MKTRVQDLKILRSLTIRSLNSDGSSGEVPVTLLGLLDILDDIDELESRLEEATRLLERAEEIMVYHETNRVTPGSRWEIGKFLESLEAFNKGGVGE